MLYCLLLMNILNYNLFDMSYQNESFGMMDPGYFVPRGQIITWINDLLKLNVTKIQMLGSGAIYCQIVDVIHPGKVALSKLNWKAKNDYEFINNLKILQNAFDKIGIKKHVEVQKLAKAKYQDNLEFIQWLKKYYDLNCGERGNNYMAEEKRGNVVIDFSFADKSIVPKTYNAGGAVKPAEKTTMPAQKAQKPKPTSTVNLQAKQQQAPTRVKSPADGKKVQPKKQPIKKPETKSTRAVKTEVKQQKQEQQQHTEQIATQAQKSQKQVIIQYRADPQLQAQLEQAFLDLQEAKKQSETHQQKLKQTTVKLDMIREILASQDDAVMKVSLIQEIFKE